MLSRFWRSRGSTALFALVVATRLGVLATGYAASVSAPDVLARFPRLTTHVLADLPARWDSFWYHGVARRGYEWDPGRRGAQQNIAFFPAYPALMRVGGDLLTIPAKLRRDPDLFGSGDTRVMWGGVLVSLVCFALAAGRVVQLARADTGDERIAFRAAALLCTYPFALFFSAAYSESLALLALVSLVLAWRRGDTRRGVAWGLVLGLSRPNGWTAAAALGADWMLGRGPGGMQRTGAAALVVMAAPIGAAIYSAYVFTLTGSALQWAAAQRAWGGVVRPASFIMRRVQDIDEHGVLGYVARDPADAITAIAVLGALALATALACRREWLYATLMVAYLAPAVLIDLPASGRMTSLLFPGFIALASALPRLPFALVAATFAIGQAWLAWRFFLWQAPY